MGVHVRPGLAGSRTGGEALVRDLPQGTDVGPVMAPDGRWYSIEAHASGVIEWNYNTGGGPDGLVEVAVLAVAWLVNLTGRVVFRFGWSLVVRDTDLKRVARRRYRSRAAAVAAMPGLAEEIARGGVR